MKEFNLILLISFSVFVHGKCQITYSKYLDINHNTQIGAKIHMIDDFAYISFLSGCTDVQVCSGVLKIDPDDIGAGPIWLDTALNLQITTKCAASEDRIFITGRYVDDWPLNQAVIRSYNLTGDTIKDFFFGPNMGDEFPGAIAIGNDRVYFHYSQDTNPDTINILTLNKNLELVREFDFVEDGPYDRGVGSRLIVAPDGYLIGAVPVGESLLFYGGITRFDTLGNVDWQVLLENSGAVSTTNLPRLDLLPGNRYAVGWQIDPFIPNVIDRVPAIYVIDSTGATEWEYFFYLPDPRWVELNDIFTTANGDVVGMGLAYIEEDGGLIHECAWVFRVSGTGELLWEREICDFSFGLDRLDALLFGGTELPNGDLLFTGTADLPVQPGSPFNRNSGIWLLRTDANGCIANNCDSLLIITDTEEPGPQTPPSYLDVYPNPAQDVLHLSVTATLPGPFRWQLLSADGRVVQTLDLIGGETRHVDVVDLAAGLYFYQFIDSGRVLETGKVVLE